MTMIEGLLQELEQEAQTTRRVLERVPDEHLGWRPSPKARTLGELALHIATVPGGEVPTPLSYTALHFPKIVIGLRCQVTKAQCTFSPLLSTWSLRS